MGCVFRLQKRVEKNKFWWLKRGKNITTLQECKQKFKLEI